MLEDKEHEILLRLRIPLQKSKAFDDLVVLYQRQVYFYVRKIVIDHDDANDISQNVFLKAWKAIDSFREDSKISTWLYRIATNESITFINKKKKLAGISFDEIQDTLPSFLENDPLYDGDEIQRKLQAAIACLPEKQRLVFILKYMEEKKYEEIAEITGTSEGALKASYHHAVKKIEVLIMKH